MRDRDGASRAVLRRRRVLLTVLLAGGLVGTLGWGLGLASPGPTQPHSHWPAPVEADDDAFAAGSLVMQDPPAGTTPVIDLTVALSVASTAGIPPDRQLGPPETALKVVSNDPTGGVPLKPGETSSGYTKKLSWVVMYRGGGSMSGSRMPVAEPDPGLASRPPLEDCVSVLVVDAEDASLLDTVTMCTESTQLPSAASER